MFVKSNHIKIRPSKFSNPWFQIINLKAKEKVLFELGRENHDSIEAI